MTPPRAEIKKLFEEKARIENELHQAGTDMPRVIDLANYTDLGNAKRFVSLHQRNIRYVPAWKCWMMWDGKRWGKKDNSSMTVLVDEMIQSMYAEANGGGHTDEVDKLRKHARATESEKAIMSTIRLAQGQPGVIAQPSDFDKNPWLFNVQNGTVNILARKLQDHNREDMITKISPIQYDATKKCDVWLLFLNRIMKTSPEVIPYLQNLSGQCLTGEVRQKAFYIFWGAGGDNGKTTFIEQIQYILDEYAQTIPIAALIKENKSSIPVDLHSLIGARFAFASEPDLGDTLTDGLIKRITGRDTMKTRTLHEKPTQWKPEFKLIIATNNKPKIPDASGAMWSRVKCIPFIEKIPKHEQDEILWKKLIDESPGILNWMLEGCFQWLDNGMIEPEIVKQTVLDYQEDSDKLAEWINYCFDKYKEGFVPFKIYYPLYKLWCDTHGVRAVQENTLPGLLENRGFYKSRGWYIDEKGNNIRDRGMFGLKLNSWLSGRENNGKNEAAVSSGQTQNASGAGGQTKPISPVHLIIEAIDVDYEQAKWLFGQVDRQKLVDALEMVISAKQINAVSSLSSLSHDNEKAISNLNTPSVQSVQSVHNNYNKEIVLLLKESFDRYNLTQLLEIHHNVPELKEFMELKIETEIDNLPDNLELSRYVFDYCKARGWE